MGQRGPCDRSCSSLWSMEGPEILPGVNQVSTEGFEQRNDLIVFMSSHDQFNR